MWIQDLMSQTSQQKAHSFQWDALANHTDVTGVNKVNNFLFFTFDFLGPPPKAVRGKSSQVYISCFQTTFPFRADKRHSKQPETDACLYFSVFGFSTVFFPAVNIQMFTCCCCFVLLHVFFLINVFHPSVYKMKTVTSLHYTNLNHRWNILNLGRACSGLPVYTEDVWLLTLV